MKAVATLLASAALLSGCATVPLLRASSLEGQPIDRVEQRYGAPDPRSPAQKAQDYVWSDSVASGRSCTMTVSISRAGLVNGVKMNGDGDACTHLRHTGAFGG